MFLIKGVMEKLVVKWMKMMANLKMILMTALQ